MDNLSESDFNAALKQYRKDVPTVGTVDGQGSECDKPRFKFIFDELNLLEN
jgi:hypothetical protein